MMINNSYTSENPFQLIHRVLLVYTRIRVSLSASGTYWSLFSTFYYRFMT